MLPKQLCKLPNYFLNQSIYLKHVSLKYSNFVLQRKNFSQLRNNVKVNNIKVEEITIPVPYGVIAGKAWGDKDGIPVLGLHGWSDNAATFDRLIPELDNSFYFVSIDFPGHGFSSHLPPGMFYTYMDFVLSVRRVINYLKWEKFSIVGHSMGAGIASIYSSVFHSDVNNLVMLDLHKNIGISDEDGTYADNINHGIISLLQTEEKLKRNSPAYPFDESVDKLIEGTLNALDEDCAKILLARGARQVEGNKWEYTRDIRLKHLHIQRYRNKDLFAMLANIRCRLLFLKAKGGTNYEDDSVFESTIALYKEKCKEFQHHHIEGNHFFHLGKPKETASYINKFLLG